MEAFLFLRVLSFLVLATAARDWPGSAAETGTSTPGFFTPHP
jgi:hypothetical protein